MVTNEMASKIYKFFKLLFVGTFFAKILIVVSIISSHVITESLVILPIYLLFSQVRVEEFQI